MCARNSAVYKGTYQRKSVAVKRIVLNPNIAGHGEGGEFQKKLKHENLLTILVVE